MTYLAELHQDVLLAARRLRRSPGFTALASLTLALGIGANATIFGIASAVMLRPLPFREPDRLVVIEQERRDGSGVRIEASYPEYREWRDEARSFAAMAAMPRTLRRFVWQDATGGERAERGAMVGAELFPTLGVNAYLGRTFLPEEDRRGAEPVLVLSYAAWQSQFGGRPSVIGERVTIDGRRNTIVGVMPEGFEYPRGARMWTPLLPAIDSLAENKQIGFARVVARLRPGVTPGQASAELDGLIDRFVTQNFPGANPVAASLTPLADDLFGDLRRPLYLLLASAALVLLIACVNVANLLLARTAARADELAVRTALGASRGRLFRQLIAEGLVLSVLSAALGVVIAIATTGALVSLVPAELYRADTVRIDGGTMAFAALLVVVTTTIFAALPARLATRHAAAATISRAGGRTTAGSASGVMARGLVTVEAAIAVVLLVGALILLRSFIALERVDLGFDPRSTLTLELQADEARYRTPAQLAGLYDALVQASEATPGVRAAAGVLLRPLQGPDGYDYPVAIEGRDAAEQRTYPLLNYEAITPRYFEAAGIPLVAGRAFGSGDVATSPPVAIVSRRVAERFWPGESPIGKRIKWGPGASQPWVQIVGIAGDARYRGLRDVSLDVYVPALQSPWPLNHLLVRAAGSPSAIAPVLRRSIADRVPGVQITGVATMRELVDSSLRRPRFHTLLVGSFAALALLLGVVGIYGVTASATVRRTRELGIRIALGAQARDVFATVVGREARAALVGTAVGLVLALGASRVLESLAFGVSVVDPLTYIVAAGLLAGAAVLATVIPAWRASRLDPVDALRAE